jgi:competence protein ComEC
MKYIFYFCAFVTLLSSVIWSQWPSSKLQVIFCDVGQGDAILLSYLSTQVLVDGGKDEKVLLCLEKFMPFWDKNLEIIVATHPDSDHIGGLSAVLKQYSSNLLVTNGVTKQTDDFAEFKTLISRKTEQNTQHVTLHQGDSLTVGKEIRLSVLSPQVDRSQFIANMGRLSETQLWDEQSAKKETDATSNNGSIVLFLEYKNTSILLTGDLESQGELSLRQRGLLTEADILKVGHHGSKTSTTPSFLAKIRPEISVISSGKNNTYNHPAPEIVTALRTENSRVYRTDQLGTLHFETDGDTIWFFNVLPNNRQSD